MSPIYDHNSLFTMEEEDAILVLPAFFVFREIATSEICCRSSQNAAQFIVVLLFSLRASLPSSIYTYDSGQDGALVTLCGFDHATFNELHILFMNSSTGSLRIANQASSKG
jgi:hypothetical protein